jgi:large subunit ribosomal protein L17
MRHKKKILRLGISRAYTRSVIRSLATALLEHKKIETTEKRAKGLKSYIDDLMSSVANLNEINAARLMNKKLFTKTAIKTLKGMKKSINAKGSNVRTTKIRKRPGDCATVVLVELI